MPIHAMPIIYRLQRFIPLLTILTVVALAACIHRSEGRSETPQAKGSTVMTQSELVDTLRKIDSNQVGGVDALAKTVTKESRSLARTAAAHLNDPDRNVADNAMSLLIQMDDLATVPLLDAPEAAGAYDAVMRMRVIVDSQLEIRKRTIDRLKTMLGDKRTLSYGTLPNTEELPPQSRVCDEAYVMLRRLLHTTEKQDAQLMNARLFLRLPEARRDVEIHKSANLMTWSDFMSGGE